MCPLILIRKSLQLSFLSMVRLRRDHWDWISILESRKGFVYLCIRVLKVQRRLWRSLTSTLRDMFCTVRRQLMARNLGSSSKIRVEGSNNMVGMITPIWLGQLVGLRLLGLV
uniref:Uncharacterized protein n=1 Tax=Opuntia streptacantha TaxID=393608 RepID=A0A7C9F2K7_OPUST